MKSFGTKRFEPNFLVPNVRKPNMPKSELLIINYFGIVRDFRRSVFRRSLKFKFESCNLLFAPVVMAFYVIFPFLLFSDFWHEFGMSLLGMTEISKFGYF